MCPPTGNKLARGAPARARLPAAAYLGDGRVQHGVLRGVEGEEERQLVAHELLDVDAASRRDVLERGGHLGGLERGGCERRGGGERRCGGRGGRGGRLQLPRQGRRRAPLLGRLERGGCAGEQLAVHGCRHVRGHLLPERDRALAPLQGAELRGEAPVLLAQAAVLVLERLERHQRLVHHRHAVHPLLGGEPQRLCQLAEALVQVVPPGLLAARLALPVLGCPPGAGTPLRRLRPLRPRHRPRLRGTLAVRCVRRIPLRANYLPKLPRAPHQSLPCCRELSCSYSALPPKAGQERGEVVPRGVQRVLNPLLLFRARPCGRDRRAGGRHRGALPPGGGA
mmetsp:Transcript_1374/g.4670  ORF Transcript_1374/g.4670 Transcript_1374/m.4670 type:complete len:338 (+) Transcript_1374:941-1954(+)